MLPFLQQAGWVASDPTPCDMGPKLTAIVEARGDRVKVAGDIIGYADYFFVSDDQMTYDEKGFQKRLSSPESREILAKFRDCLAATDDWTVAGLDKAMHDFVNQQEIKIGDIIHSSRLAVTGKTVGPGMFDCLAILGKESCLARIERTLMLANQQFTG